MDNIPRCAICHRQLKDPVSVARGIGPVCRSKSLAGQPIRTRHNRVVAGQYHFLERLLEKQEAGV